MNTFRWSFGLHCICYFNLILNIIEKISNNFALKRKTPLPPPPHTHKLHSPINEQCRQVSCFKGHANLGNYRTDQLVMAFTKMPHQWLTTIDKFYKTQRSHKVGVDTVDTVHFLQLKLRHSCKCT